MYSLYAGLIHTFTSCLVTIQIGLYAILCIFLIGNPFKLATTINHYPTIDWFIYGEPWRDKICVSFVVFLLVHPVICSTYLYVYVEC